MLASIEEIFQYNLKSGDGTEYGFYRKGPGVYYDLIFHNTTVKHNHYSGDLSALFQIVKHFTKIGLNPYYVPTSGNPVIDKMKEMEARFASKHQAKPVSTPKPVSYVVHYT